MTCVWWEKMLQILVYEKLEHLSAKHALTYCTVKHTVAIGMHWHISDEVEFAWSEKVEWRMWWDINMASKYIFGTRKVFGSILGATNNQQGNWIMKCELTVSWPVKRVSSASVPRNSVTMWWWTWQTSISRNSKFPLTLLWIMWKNICYSTETITKWDLECLCLQESIRPLLVPFLPFNLCLSNGPMNCSDPNRTHPRWLSCYQGWHRKPEVLSQQPNAQRRRDCLLQQVLNLSNHLWIQKINLSNDWFELKAITTVLMVILLILLTKFMQFRFKTFLISSA